MSTISAAAAQRILNLPRTRFENLINNGLITKTPDGVTLDSIHTIKSIMDNRTYNKGLAGATRNNVHLAVPVSNPTLGNSMYLAANNDRQDAIDGLAAQGHPLTSSEDVTGWWAISDKNLTELLAPGTIVLGVVAGITIQAATYTGTHYTDPLTNRRALVVQPLNDRDAAPYMGNLGRMNQGVAYVY